MSGNQKISKDDVLKAIDFHAFYSVELNKLGQPNADGYAMAICPFHGDTNGTGAKGMSQLAASDGQPR